MMRALLLLCCSLSAAAPAAAQSLFATSGLGVPVAPLDARARALGGIGVGLFDFNASLVNPAEIAGVPYRGVAAAFQPTSNTVEFGGESDEIGGTRFPLLRVIYPFSSRFVGSLGYGSVLDQSWAAFSESRQLIGSDSLGVRDAITARGGIAQLQATLAYQLSPALAFGVGAGIYTGELQRRTTRSFTTDSGSVPLAPFEVLSTTAYNGRTVVVGGLWDVSSVVRVGAAYQWSGDLDADSVSGNTRDATHAMPSQLSVGVSATLAPRLSATAGVRRATADGIEDVLELGGGVEWGGFALGGRRLPLRLGYNRADLPYGIGRNGEASESSFALGLGGRFAVTEDGPLARVDAAVERGTRDGEGNPFSGNTLVTATLTENFWRFTLSMSLFGR